MNDREVYEKYLREVLQKYSKLGMVLPEAAKVEFEDLRTMLLRLVPKSGTVHTSAATDSITATPPPPENKLDLGQQIKRLEKELDFIGKNATDTATRGLPQTAPKREPFAVLTIMPDQFSVSTGSADYKPLGQRWAELARRLGMVPYPVDPETEKPLKRGIYVSDGKAYFDLAELFNRLLDHIGIPE